MSRERNVIHIRDVLGDADVAPGLREIAEQIGVGTYSQVIAPMLWEGESIGSLYVIRQPAVGFSDKEIGLLRTFADQAVIAIQNARLFNETREALRKVELRTAELSEALDYQTAISDVLRVISQLAHRRRAGLRGDPRQRDATVRKPGVGRVPLRRPPRPPRRHAQLAERRRSTTHAASIRARRTRR